LSNGKILILYLKADTYGMFLWFFISMAAHKVALVTGGGTGIGKAIALQLAQSGAKVAIASRNLARVESAAEKFRNRGLAVLPVSMDVTKKTDVERAITTIVSQWGAPHILVNNAGISGLS